LPFEWFAKPGQFGHILATWTVRWRLDGKVGAGRQGGGWTAKWQLDGKVAGRGKGAMVRAAKRTGS
jgi:hypothetical protein